MKEKLFSGFFPEQTKKAVVEVEVLQCFFEYLGGKEWWSNKRESSIKNGNDEGLVDSQLTKAAAACAFQETSPISFYSVPMQFWTWWTRTTLGCIKDRFFVLLSFFWRCFSMQKRLSHCRNKTKKIWVLANWLWFCGGQIFDLGEECAAAEPKCGFSSIWSVFVRIHTLCKLVKLRKRAGKSQS